MYSIETLRAADYYEWWASGKTAATQLRCNQSTISRRYRSVMQPLKKGEVRGAYSLIAMERKVSQHWRFSRELDLRLHLYRWTNQLTRRRLPPYWQVNPGEISVTKKPVVELLKSRVIDAFCAPYPLIAELDLDQFSLLPLYSTPLCLLADAADDLTQERCLTSSDIRLGSRLGRLDFVPEEAHRCSRTIDAQIFADGDGLNVNPITRYWGTTLTPLVRADLAVLDHPVAVTYTEFLVVLPEWKEHSCTVHLVDQLSQCLQTHSELNLTRHPISVDSSKGWLAPSTGAPG
jgi:hypothetical protein